MLFYIILFPLTALLGITLYNFFTIPKLSKNRIVRDQSKLISILIPARNEENNIENSLLSAINQTYQNTEIIVLDDKSDDKTSEKVLNIIRKYPNKKIQLYNGTELPDGWNGKSWACFNLSKYSNGEYILFIDADVILDKNAVESALFEIESNSFDLLTAFSTQIYKTWGEFIVVQIAMNWPVGTLLPVRFSQNSNFPSFTGACGQFMFFKKSSYDSVGGHQVVGKNIVEEMEMALAMKKNKFKVGTYLGNKVVFCHMYDGFKKSIQGFANPFYPLTKMNSIQFFAFLFALPGVYFWPLVLVFIDPIFVYAILLIILNKFILAKMFNESVFKSILVHPIQMILFTYIGIISYYRTVSGNLVWKGRSIKQQLNT